MSREKSQYLDLKYQIPSEFRKWRSPYQFDSEELQNLQQQTISPVFTQTILLSTAQSPSNPLQIQCQGRAFRLSGHTTATQYNFNANTGIETSVTTAIVGVWVNQKGGPSDALFIKNGGGFRGDFLNLFLFWPAQASNSARITIYTYDDNPWQSGDAST